jgi:ABC-type Fe3+-hydroxamate transport system substrate-binding protein
MNKQPALRIISLVPSITELLYYLGLENETIGITKFCVHPSHWFKNKSRVGGTKNVDIAKVVSLSPDIVIYNKEENVEDQILAIAAQVNVFGTDVCTFEDAILMIKEIGELTNKTLQANILIDKINHSFKVFTPKKIFKAAYIIWKDPYMTIGNDTFIHSMMQKAGLANIFSDKLRYPAIEIEQLKEAEIILLATEPYPFKEKHIADLESILPNAKIFLVDGEMFSWYGSRMLYAAAYFEKLIKVLENR